MPDDEFREAFEETKRASVSQLLIKAGRLANERGISRIPREPGQARLRPSHMAVFPHVEFEGTRMSTIAERLGVSKQAVSQLVGDLEAMGVLQRVRDPSDGRARLVKFSEEGPKFLMQGMQVLASVDTDLRRKLGEERYGQFREVLLDVVEELEGD